MAGKPRVKRVMGDLTLLAIAELEGEVDSPTALDYVEYWITNGDTMINLAAKLQDDSKLSGLGAYEPVLEGGGLARMLRRTFDTPEAARVDEMLARARARGSQALVERTHAIADEVVRSSEEAARARNRIGTRQWAAERFDRGTFGQPRGNQVNVQINMGEAHLDALRRRALPTIVPVANGQQHIGTQDSVVTIEPEFVTIVEGDAAAPTEQQRMLTPSNTTT